MTIEELLAACDHTLLKQTATEEEILALCDDATHYRTASVCVPPCYVRTAKDRLTSSSVKVCTVIGFPNGNVTTDTKVFETKNAIQNGADEIDMVINIGMVKAGEDDRVLNEICVIRNACAGKLLKVIVETCLLTEDEKIRMCKVVTASGADYIKTSTGFSTGGATFDDVRLFREHIGPAVRIKAAGGIATLADAAEFLRLGVSRLGTSRVVALVKEGQTI